MSAIDNLDENKDENERPVELSPEPNYPFWGFGDVALFIGAVLPSFMLAALLLRLARAVAPGYFVRETWKSFLFQGFAYVFLVGALYLVVAWRHRQPFWSSLGWRFPIPHAFSLVMAGPVVALTLAASAVFLGLPQQTSELEDLLNGRRALAAWALWGVIVAPAFEELVFRGFLFPVLARGVGPWLGIVLTAIPFGLLHGAQNHWAWQPVVLITFAGIIFGAVRYKTGSTSAAFLLHAAYNGTEFGLFAVTRWAQLN